MNFQFDMIEDKIEFFEGTDLKMIEKKINEQIEYNRAIMLGVQSVSHQMHIDENGKSYYTAVVHFKIKK
jgi:hypothetical protein